MTAVVYQNGSDGKIDEYSGYIDFYGHVIHPILILSSFLKNKSNFSSDSSFWTFFITEHLTVYAVCFVQSYLDLMFV